MKTRSPNEQKELFSKAQEKMAALGLRKTIPRETILRAAFTFDEAFDINDLLRKAQEEDKLISMPTVYRNIIHLLSTGLVREVDLGKDRRYYEVCGESSGKAGYIICSDCQRVVDLKDDCLKLRESYVADSLGFKPRKANIRIEADCKELHSTGKCSHCRKK